MAKVEFKGCEHLDFDTNYHAKKQVLASGQVFWLRDVDPDMPSMVQFCKLRGRMNFPTACTCKEYAQCSDYAEVEHSVEAHED